jgi:hypothetical protein
MQNHLPSLVEKYGDKLEIVSIETSNPANYEIYLSAIDLFNVPPVRQGVPALYIGDTHLVGSGEIESKLEGLVEEHLIKGGVEFPPIAGLDIGIE